MLAKLALRSLAADFNGSHLRLTLDASPELQLYAIGKLGWCLPVVPAAAVLAVELFSQAEEGCWELGLLPAQSCLQPAGEESCRPDSSICGRRGNYKPLLRKYHRCTNEACAANCLYQKLVIIQSSPRITNCNTSITCLLQGEV